MKASIFITCVCDSFYPQVVEAMVRILEKHNVTLDLPKEQTCCGQPAFNSGYWDDTREVAKSLLDAFKDSEYVVAPSGSCVSAIKEFYPIIFEKDPYYYPLAKDLVGKVYEFTEFLVKVLKVEDLGISFPHRVTYHPNCHANRLLGINPIVIGILEKVKDMEFVMLPHQDTCCGFGGTFSVKMPEISEAMVDEKVANILKTEANVLVGTDMGCLMNIQGRLLKQGANVRVMHIAELIDEGMKV